MDPSATFHLDLTETFPSLANAPIVEAVIQWTARATKPFDRETLRRELTERLPDYPQRQLLHMRQLESQIAADGSTTETRQEGWHGFRLIAADALHVIQMSRDGVAFSRLSPYEKWEDFSAAAQRAWKIFVELAEPSEVERLGVRYINRVLPVRLNDVGSYLSSPPRCLESSGLPVRDFLYQSRHDVPGHPFQINVIQAVQPPAPPDAEGFGLILDIDVSTTKPFPPTDEIVQDFLPKMRWVKNKAFFSLMSKTAIQSFERGKA